MPTPQPAQIDRLLVDALALPVAARHDFLREACGSDAHLFGELQKLLQLHERAGDFLEQPAAAAFESLQASIGEHQSQVGARIGPYHLLERIGEGGFGTVYVAEQEQPVRRRVALKIIKLGMDTRQVIARFEAERQALAMMDHPNIARVLDAGATDGVICGTGLQPVVAAGRPYFVMELVRGVPITRYCDEHKLTIRERLELAVDVCHAVQHAHTKGIIHRDLKSSNVLVSRHDERPVVKVIDFGIAKATGGRLTDKTLYTELHQLIGTPAYMSPEQAGLSDLDIDTRSDIYSLGVLLYELLTGMTPFDAKALASAGFDEMRRIIREVEPEKPSTRVGSGLRPRRDVASDLHVRGSSEPDTRASGDSSAAGAIVGTSSSAGRSAAIVALRDSSSKLLARSLRGDLDWIVMKCLEKDRTRRYETTSALAADVRRHLAGEPVVAAPPSRLYRLSKTLRRNRTGVAVAAMFVVLILAGLAGTSTLWRQAAQARDAEAEQRTRAAAVSTFLKEMLTAADPARTKGAKLTVREALDEAAKRIDTSPLAAQPLVEADVRATIGATYFALGLYPQAQSHLRAAESILSREIGDDHPDVLRTRSRLAQCYAWEGDHVQAVAFARPTFERQRRVLGPEHPETLRTLSFLGNALMLSDEPIDEPERLLREALAGQTRQLGREHADTIETMLYLAWELSQRSEEGLSLSQEAFELATRTLGPDHPHTCTAMLTLGLTYSWVGKWTEAETWLRRALETTRRVFGEENHRVADCLADSSRCQTQRGEHAAAVESARQSMEIARRTYGPGKKWTIRYTKAFAAALWAAKRDGECLQVLEDGLAEARHGLGDEDFETLLIQIDYADALFRAGRYNESVEYCTHGVEIALRKAGPAHWLTRTYCRSRANSLWALGRRDEAQAFMLANLDACRAARGDRAVQTLAELNFCARFLRARGKVAEAEPLAREALEGFRLTDPKLRLRMGNPADTLAHCLSQLDRPREALEFAVESARNARAKPEHLNFAAWLLLTTTAEELRNPTLALEFAQKANELSHHQFAWQLDTLALAYHRTGDTTKAIELQTRALSLLAADAPGRAEYEERLHEFQAASESAADKR